MSCFMSHPRGDGGTVTLAVLPQGQTLARRRILLKGALQGDPVHIGKSECLAALNDPFFRWGGRHRTTDHNGRLVCTLYPPLYKKHLGATVSSQPQGNLPPSDGSLHHPDYYARDARHTARQANDRAYKPLNDLKKALVGDNNASHRSAIHRLNCTLVSLFLGPGHSKLAKPCHQMALEKTLGVKDQSCPML